MEMKMRWLGGVTGKLAGEDEEDGNVDTKKQKIVEDDQTAKRVKSKPKGQLPVWEVPPADNICSPPHNGNL